MEEMIAEEHESSSAQIRTLLNEQRKTIIAEYCEKVSHREFFAAQAEQNAEFYRENYCDNNRIFVKRGIASNPQPPHRSGHGCTVGYDRDPPV